jgi:hypothetical protein
LIIIIHITNNHGNSFSIKNLSDIERLSVKN